MRRLTASQMCQVFGGHTVNARNDPYLMSSENPVEARKTIAHDPSSTTTVTIAGATVEEFDRNRLSNVES